MALYVNNYEWHVREFFPDLTIFALVYGQVTLIQADGDELEWCYKVAKVVRREGRVIRFTHPMDLSKILMALREISI